ncbi:MAG: hypothetical protein FWG10_12995, partial [Eubacteriaceae bacterium]|nr:hypothetical protein [Eubacteriaceae bacterium]
QGRNGLLAVYYRNSSENGHGAGTQILVDAFDRKTGRCYKVFAEPTVALDTAVFEPYQDGFKIGIDTDNLLYCFVDDIGNLCLELVAP